MSRQGFCRRVGGSLAAVVGALIAIGVPAMPVQAGYTPTKVIRTAATGRVPNLGDIATTGTRVAVTWADTDTGFGGSDEPRVYLRTSADRGDTWGSVTLVEAGEHSDQPSVAICDGRYLMLAYAVDLRLPVMFPRRWHIILYQRDLVTGDESYEEISTGNERAQFPDVACGSDRVWIAWDDKHGAERHIFLRHGVVGPLGTVSLVPAIDLGRSRPTGNSTRSGPSVTAVDGKGYVAWGGWQPDGVLVRFKRYAVGPGPGHAVTPDATVTLKSLDPVPRHPMVAASGDRVAVAYGLTFDRFGVRVSGDHGDSFGTQKVLRFPAPHGGEPNHLSMRGSRILILAEAYVKGPSDTFRYLSVNGGDSFSRTSLGNNRGQRVGGFVTQGGTPRVVEAWDGHWYNDRKLRFHRDS